MNSSNSVSNTSARKSNSIIYVFLLLLVLGFLALIAFYIYNSVINNANFYQPSQTQQTDFSHSSLPSQPPQVQPQPSPEVFGVSGYTYTKDQALNACQAYGADLATKQQLQDAQTHGANWCSTGWLKDTNDAEYPITTSTQTGCGNGKTGVMSYTPQNNLAGVNCFGSKPAQGTKQILPFNMSKWSIFS